MWVDQSTSYLFHWIKGYLVNEETPGWGVGS